MLDKEDGNFHWETAIKSVFSVTAPSFFPVFRIMGVHGKVLLNDIILARQPTESSLTSGLINDLERQLVHSRVWNTLQSS